MLRPDGPSNSSKDGLKPYHWLLISGGLLIIFFLVVYSYSDQAEPKPQAASAQLYSDQAELKSQTASLNQIAEAIQADQVRKLTVVDNDLIFAGKKDGTSLIARKEANVSAIEALQLTGAPFDKLTKIPLIIEAPPTHLSLGSILWPALMLGVVGCLIFYYSRQMKKLGSGHGSNYFSRSNARLMPAADKVNKRVCLERPQVTFLDVAGVEQAKLELQEVVEFLKEPLKFTRLGARTPKGVLLAGLPGTGKTLLAKAVAGEASVPFLSISGSEFVEVFVGVGAARVRDLFKQATEHAPAVIFVDEIDAVGRRRGASMGNGNDEREQTLNQILVEMDGFNTDTRLIVIAATNRLDILDPALIRPGRFDRKIILDRPHRQGREAILKVHSKGKPLAADVSLDNLAKLTPGFVGADLENLVNEAAILAARRNLNRIGMPEFQDAMERIIAGPERQGKILNACEREVVAYHEAGHAVVMHHLPHSDPVHKVSIISRGLALGYTMPLPEGDKYLRTQAAFEDELVGLLAGRAAEEIIFRQVTTGAANDLERATHLARAMVTRYGFSQTLGLRTFGEEQDNSYLGSLGAIRNYSEAMTQAIDHEINQILEAAYERAKYIVVEQQQRLENLAQALLEVETIERPQFEALMA